MANEADIEFERALARQEHEAWICERLIAWLQDEKRMPAVSAFTAGPVRDVARVMERLIRS